MQQACDWSMRVAILGGTGFVGSNIAGKLVAAGHDVSLLVRRGSEDKVPAIPLWRQTSGDIGDERALDDTLSGCEAVIYSIGLLREFPARGITFEETQFAGVVRTIAAARRKQVPRFVLISANGVRLPGTPYQETKLRAEQELDASGLATAILRPSVIFGDPGTNMEFATQLYRDMVAKPLPAIGFFTGLHPRTGAVRLSPVHIDDVATVAALVMQDPPGTEPLVLGGPEVLSWAEMVQRIAAAVGKRKLVIPMPIAAMQLAARLLDRIPAFPVTRDQLTMLAENNTAEPGVLERLIGRPAKAFVPDNLRYLQAR